VLYNFCCSLSAASIFTYYLFRKKNAGRAGATPLSLPETFYGLAGRAVEMRFMYRRACGMELHIPQRRTILPAASYLWRLCAGLPYGRTPLYWKKDFQAGAAILYQHGTLKQPLANATITALGVWAGLLLSYHHRALLRVASFPHAASLPAVMLSPVLSVHRDITGKRVGRAGRDMLWPSCICM